MATPAKAYPHHVMPRMLEGVFVGPGQAVGGTPTRFASAVLPLLTANPESDTKLVCLDLVQVSFADNPNDWTWSVLSHAGVYTWGHTIGLNLHEPWKFVTWELGPPRVYEVGYADPLPPGDIPRLYGTDAAGAARPDYNAVQLSLTRRP
jgi:hypothetical protein